MQPKKGWDCPDCGEPLVRKDPQETPVSPCPDRETCGHLLADDCPFRDAPVLPMQTDKRTFAGDHFMGHAHGNVQRLILQLSALLGHLPYASSDLIDKPRAKMVDKVYWAFLFCIVREELQLTGSCTALCIGRNMPSFLLIRVIGL